eukprot:1793821-Pleurochrysis_carterae.AAC.1
MVLIHRPRPSHCLTLPPSLPPPPPSSESGDVEQPPPQPQVGSSRVTRSQSRARAAAGLTSALYRHWWNRCRQRRRRTLPR